MKWEKHISRREFFTASAAGAGALSLARSQALAVDPERGGDVWREARALMDSGAIGRPYYAGLRVPCGAISADDIAGHVARVAYALRLDAPHRVSAAGSDLEGDGFPADFMITAKYAEGVTLSIVTGEGARGGGPYVIRGEGGTLKIYDSPRPRIELLTDPRSDSGDAVFVCNLCSRGEAAADWRQLVAARRTAESALDSLRGGRPRIA